MAPTHSSEHFAEAALIHAHQDYVRVRADQTLTEALESVRRSGTTQRIVYFYVLDAHERLCGVVPTRRLLLNDPDSLVREIMVTNLVSLPSSATLLDACELFILHRLLAVPLVDDDGRILGVVDVELYTDEISDLMRQEEENDVFQLIGVRLEQLRRASVLAAFGQRFPWLLCNILGGLACAFLAGVFDVVLAQVVLLSLFIPVVLALGESVGIQSLTLTLQAQHHSRPSLKDLIRQLRRETAVAILLGVSCGILVGGCELAWKGHPLVALCILVSITGSIISASVIGLAVPSLLRRLHVDPKVASGPIVLASTDLVTLFYYLGLATLVLV